MPLKRKLKSDKGQRKVWFFMLPSNLQTARPFDSLIALCFAVWSLSSNAAVIFDQQSSGSAETKAKI